MIDLLSATQTLLRDSGYDTRLRAYGPAAVLSFEDESVMGFCYVFEDTDAMLKSWKTTETEFLNRYGARFRIAGDKAWNIYCVFLTGSETDVESERQVRWIEENLDRTRKIAACGVATRESLVKVLLPLLRLQYKPLLEHEDLDARLQQRLSVIAPNAAKVALRADVSPTEIARLLAESI